VTGELLLGALNHFGEPRARNLTREVLALLVEDYLD
jgi:hypothetical protein